MSRLWLIAIAIVAAGVLWWAWALRDRRPTDDDAGTTDSREAQPPAPIDGAPLAAKPNDATSDAPSRDDKPAAANETRRTFRVRGRVHMERGEMPKGALIAVVGRVGSDDRYLARWAPAADGAFDREVPAPDGDGPWPVTIGAWIPGHAWVEQRASASVATPTDVDLEMPESGRISGSIVDDRGQPVAGLAFTLVSSASLLNLIETPNPATDATRGGFGVEASAVGTSDDEGRFAVAGLREGLIYDALSSDARWWLEAEGREGIRTPADDLRIVARPGFRVDVTLDGADDDPVVRWSNPLVAFQIAEPQNHGAWTLSTRPGSPFFLRGPVTADLRDGFDLRVRCDTRLHRPETTIVRLGPGAWMQSIRVQLTRYRDEEIGTLVLETGLRDRDRNPLRLSMQDERTTLAGAKVGDVVTLAPRPDGRWEASLPAGRRTLSIRAESSVLDAPTWNGEVDVIGGRATPFHVPFPRCGSVRFRFASDALGSLALDSVDGTSTSSWGGAPKGGELYAPAIRVGAYTATWTLGNQSKRTTFSVIEGSETVADLTR
jgi:hypothetical protein